MDLLSKPPACRRGQKLKGSPNFAALTSFLVFHQYGPLSQRFAVKGISDPNFARAIQHLASVAVLVSGSPFGCERIYLADELSYPTSTTPNAATVWNWRSWALSCNFPQGFRSTMEIISIHTTTSRRSHWKRSKKKVVAPACSGELLAAKLLASGRVTGT